MALGGRVVLLIAAVVVIASASLSVHGESIAGVALGQFFEPSTILLVGAALVGLGSFARKRMKPRK